jgi:hypothetical protein
MPKNRSQSPPVADSKPGQYSDGHPLDEVQYLECKLILKPDRFTAAKVFLDYGKLVAKTAKEFGVGFSNKGVVIGPAIREVVFLDTADFRLYKFIYLTAAYCLRIRFSHRRTGDRFHVSSRRYAEGCGSRRATKHCRQLSD